MNKKEIIKTLLDADQEFGHVPLLHRIYGKNVKIKIGFSESVYRASIDELSLSVRSHKALRRAGIATLGDLIERLNEGDLKSIRNLGAKSFSEIQTKMLQFGFDRLTEAEKAKFFADLLESNHLA